MSVWPAALMALALPGAPKLNRNPPGEILEPNAVAE